MIENLTFKNRELIVKEIQEDKADDMFNIPDTDMERLVKCEVISVGEECTKAKVSDTILIRKDLLKDIKRPELRAFKQIFNEVNIHSWIS